MVKISVCDDPKWRCIDAGGCQDYAQIKSCLVSRRVLSPFWMSRRMFSKHYYRRTIAVFRFLLLLIFAWPGPRPIAHAHTPGMAGFRDGQSLIVHLDRYHSRDRSPVGSSDVLHFHWIMPDVADAEFAAKGSSVNLLPLEDYSLSISIELCFDGELLVDSTTCPELSIRLESRRDFLEHSSNRQRLVQLFCVALC